MIRLSQEASDGSIEICKSLCASDGEKSLSATVINLGGKCVQGVRVTEVPLSTASLSSGDVFILDGGAKIYVWTGASASPLEKNKALTHTIMLRDDSAHQGKSQVGPCSVLGTELRGAPWSGCTFWELQIVARLKSHYLKASRMDTPLHACVYEAMYGISNVPDGHPSPCIHLQGCVWFLGVRYEISYPERAEQMVHFLHTECGGEGIAMLKDLPELEQRGTCSLVICDTTRKRL